MTGPEHYAAAEQALGNADDAVSMGEYTEATHLYAAAQVHATLALAAATVDVVSTPARNSWRVALDGPKACDNGPLGCDPLTGYQAEHCPVHGERARAAARSGEPR